MLDEKTEGRILEFILAAKEPIHSTEIAKALGINRVTITKYLSVLESKGIISYKQLGMAKAWSAVESPVLRAFEENDTGHPMLHMLNALPDGVCVLDRDMRVVWLNKEMEKRNNRLEEAKGKKCFDVFHSEEEICKNCPVKEVFATGKACSAAVKKKDFTLEISAAPLKDQKGKVVAAIKIARFVKPGKKG